MNIKQRLHEVQSVEEANALLSQDNSGTGHRFSLVQCYGTFNNLRILICESVVLPDPISSQGEHELSPTSSEGIRNPQSICGASPTPDQAKD